MATDGTVSFGNKIFSEKKLYLADEDFFSLFSFPLVKGDPATALKYPGNVVLTETTAKKYFGNQDPMGKVIELSKQFQLKVTGIAKDIPTNSHLDFDLVVPLSNYFKMDWFNVWINNNFFTYALLADNINKAQLEKRFPQFMDKYMGSDMERIGARLELCSYAFIRYLF